MLITYKSKGISSISQPVTQMVGNDAIKLYDDYSIIIKNNLFTIERGFTCDGASVPRFAWSILGVCKFGGINAASIPHDKIYMSRGILSNGMKITRKEADELFVEHIIQLGVIKQSSAWLYKQSLRYFGYFFTKYWKEWY